MQEVVFSTLSSFCTSSKAHWPGTSSICQPLASEEDSEKILQPSIRKRRGDKGNLSCSFNRAFPCKVPRLPTAITVDFTGLAAVDGYVPSLTTPETDHKYLEAYLVHRHLDSIYQYHHALPVAFHFGAVFLNVTKLSTRITLLLISVVTVSSKMTRFATVIATLLSLFPWLLAILCNMSTSSTIIAS